MTTIEPFEEWPGDVPTCPIHGNEVEPDGFCDNCALADLERSYTPADDAEDARYEWERDRD